MLKIGLTGGIGSGKSTVAKQFTKLKVPVIDADLIAHELLASNNKISKKIVSHFSKDILTPQNRIDKKKLRNLIFSNKKDRLWLEKLMHPAIQKKMHSMIKNTRSPYCILMAPLLFETKFPIKTDRILVIDCWKKDQIKRIQQRDKSSIKQIQAIINAQIDRASRLKKADDIISNTGSLDYLRKTVKKLHYYYLSLA